MPGIAGDRFLIPSVPHSPVPAAGGVMMLHRYLAQTLGGADVCAVVPPNTHPASGTDLEGVVGRWGQTPGLAAPHVLLQGPGSGCIAVLFLVSNGSCTI